MPLTLPQFRTDGVSNVAQLSWRSSATMGASPKFVPGFRRILLLLVHNLLVYRGKIGGGIVL